MHIDIDINHFIKVNGNPKTLFSLKTLPKSAVEKSRTIHTPNFWTSDLDH